jgi:4-hydroxybenzoate polyprenyltransferase
MTEERAPIPAGAVSTIRGRWQAPGLTWLTWVVLAAATVSAFAPGRAGAALAVSAVSAVIATPLVRVAWLVLRWSQEQDWRFVVAGVALLAVVGLGASLAALGVGG